MWQVTREFSVTFLFLEEDFAMSDQMRQSFKAAAQPNQAQTPSRALAQAIAKQPRPGMQLNPPAPQKQINTQIALDQAHATKIEKQLTQSGSIKQTPLASQAFKTAAIKQTSATKKALSQAIAKRQLTNSFNQSSQLRQSRQIGRGIAK